MHYSWWDALKDFMGALGPILIAVPWFRDFFQRRLLTRLREVAAAERMRVLRDQLADSARQKLESPKLSDFTWTLTGLGLIFGSFVIAFVRGIGDLLTLR